MFDQPITVTAKVFATIPADFKPRVPSEWAAGQPRGMPGSVLEGPAFDREGNLYCVDIPNGRIFRVNPSGDFTLVVEYDGWPNGLSIHRDGRIFVADYKNGIMVLDPVSGAIEPYLTRFGVERFKAVNDLVFASNGDLYFTDQGTTGLHDPTGRLFRLLANGRLECILNILPGPNGVVLNDDETQVYVATTRTNCIWRVPLTEAGEPIKVGIFLYLSGGGGPDGLALTRDGGLAVAHVGLGCAWIFSKLGEPLYRVKSPIGNFVTNLAFGGPDGTSLFITEGSSMSILRADLPIAGKATFSHQD
ncbi:MAG: SMP-30/gluconolactonase/LRE family protein [Tabrizicola sp.]|nr:SMP-30/gluconolactonase/LRE family protein [Tabrizicola sp.]